MLHYVWENGRLIPNTTCPSTPHINTNPVIIPDVKTTIAEKDADRAAKVLERTSQDEVAKDTLAPAAAEFAKQGRGSRGSVRRKRTLFGGERVDYFLEPL